MRGTAGENRGGYVLACSADRAGAVPAEHTMGALPGGGLERDPNGIGALRRAGDQSGQLLVFGFPAPAQHSILADVLAGTFEGAATDDTDQL
jgi:hypothetical protein